MSKTKKSFELTKEERLQAIQEIKKYFFTERDEEIGDLGAGLILDFFIEKIGPTVYNQGVFDAQRYLQDKVEDLGGLLR